VGLGNPGPEYEGTRHNVGAEVVALLAQRAGERLKRGKELALVAELRSGGRRLVVAFPQTWMNESGQSAGALVRRHDVGMDRLVVVHDELDLPTGRVKVKLGGGLAGHKGLQSLKAHLGDAGFMRVRIGIGRPPGRSSGADYVLKKPGKSERAELDVAVQQAADAVELILAEGVDVAMARTNGVT
jgi:PTH1 family peptidyl-tRNA hydrolase